MKTTISAPLTGRGFIQLSPWGRDLTRHISHGELWRPYPSAYMLCRCGASPEALSTDMVCAYEDRLAVYTDAAGFGSTPEECARWCRFARDLFWDTLDKTGIAVQTASDEDGSEAVALEGVCWAGPVNVVSDRGVAGENYSEIFVSVPPGAGAREYRIVPSADVWQEAGECGPGLHGWAEGELPEGVSGWAAAWPGEPVRLGRGGSGRVRCPEWDPSSEDHVHTISAELPDGERDMRFDCVALFYDVTCTDGDGTRHVVRGVPLGIYHLGRTHLKEFDSPDLRGGGTGWSMRVRLRYYAQPAMAGTDAPALEGDDAISWADRTMGDISGLLAEMSRLRAELADARTEHAERLREFQTYKVNVPYIRETADGPKWFVNGRSIGPAVPAGTEERIAALEAEVAALKEKIG